MLFVDVNINLELDTPNSALIVEDPCANLEMAEYGVVYMEDFNNGTHEEIPSGWNVTDYPLGYRIIRVWDPNVTTHSTLPTKALLVTDNSASAFVEGNTSFGYSIEKGIFGFDLNGYAGTPGYYGPYFICLENETYSPIITINITLRYPTTTEWIVEVENQLVGVYNHLDILHMKISFKNQFLSVFVNNTLELSAVPYEGGSISGLRVKSTLFGGGNEIYLDNLVLTENDVPLVIDGNPQLAAKAVSGSGDEWDPYIIEDLQISASGWGMDGISISNSDAHFILRNCNITDADTPYVGIRLDNVMNGVITNNIVMDNSQGIWVWFSDEIEVSDNTVNENSGHGIYIDSANGWNTLDNNTINSNGGSGIYLTGSPGFTLTDNTINLNGECGIYLPGSPDCTLTNNNINFNGAEGIFLKESWHEGIVTDNTVNQNGQNMVNGHGSGIHLEMVSEITLTNNIANDNYDSGIWLEESIEIDLMNNIANGNGEDGIYFNLNSDGNTLFNNTANQNDVNGINLHDCDSYTLTKNTANLNHEHGIVLDNSEGSILTENTAILNGWHGICLQSNCNLCTLNGNNVSQNGQMSVDGCGIYSQNSNYLNLTGNYANQNGIGPDLNTGIQIEWGNNATLINNVANNNALNGIGLYSIYFSTCFNNIVCDNDENGLFIDSGSYENDIINNSITLNDVYGIAVTGDDNYFHHNVIWQNTVDQILDTGINNTWDANLLNESGDFDGDGIINVVELFGETDPYLNDTDSDGLNDGEELLIHLTNATNPDTDGDGLIDGDEILIYTTDPLDTDSDDDVIPDKWEVDNALSPLNPSDVLIDYDLDGLINFEEYLYNTSPHDTDTDNDLLPDGWEIDNLLDPLNISDALDDFDLDNLTNLVEYGLDTDPNDWDTDDDLLPDKWEVDNSLSPLNALDATIDNDLDELINLVEFLCNTNPHDADTDNDTLPDGWEVDNLLDPLNNSDALDDFDLDNLTNLAEYSLETDPNDSDTDDDLLPDKWEIDNALSPLNALDASYDIDVDQLTNLQEYFLHTDIRDADSDDDGVTDGAEVAAGTNPLDQLDFPSTPSPGFPLLEVAIIVGSIALSAAIIIHGFLRRKAPQKPPSQPPKKPPKSPKKVIQNA